MRPQSFMRVFLGLAALHYASPAEGKPLMNHMIQELAAPLQPRQQSTFAVTGVTQFGVQPRIEIRQMQQDTDLWNIYIFGLVRMMQVNQSEQLSYYQIAGIHGRPYIPWDGVQAAPNTTGPGYCTHVSNLFLPWHRPYLALYEQVLYSHIIDAVNDFPDAEDRQRYAAAALTWRQPYWDWAAPPPSGESVYPTVLTTPTITVTMPNGTNTIPNPLFAYHFHPIVATDMYFNPFASWNTTMRYPTSWDIDATSQNSLIGPILDNNRISFQDRLYNLFTSYNNFSQFGNEAWITSNIANADSIESVHDAIHSITGSNGHMTYLDYSAFDPIFWLHHSMIDRCFALWQALYTDSYVEPLAAPEGTFTIVQGTVETETSPLTPFHTDTTGDFYTSDSARSTTSFGYTYPELAGNASQSSIRAAINSLYGNGAGNSAISRREKRHLAAAEREVSGEANVNTEVSDEAVNGKQREYLANIFSQKFALNGSYAIYVFMGDYGETSAEWPTDPNLVGTHAVFAAIAGNVSSDLPITGVVPLTTMLLEKVSEGQLSCMDPEDVVPYLTENLAWRVAMMDGSEVPAEEVPGLSLTVVTAEVQPASAPDDFPQWGSFSVLANITEGKPGGC